MTVEDGTHETWGPKILARVAEDHAGHVLTVEQASGPARLYRCHRPGTGAGSFWLMASRNYFTVFGDMGDGVWRTSVNASEGQVESWICSAVRSHGYVFEKRQTREPDVVLRGEVKRVVEETREVDMPEVEREMYLECLDVADTAEEILHALYDLSGGDFEVGETVCSPSQRDWTLLGCLQTFARLYKEHKRAEGVSDEQ